MVFTAVFQIINTLIFLGIIGLGLYVVFLVIKFLKVATEACIIYINKSRNG